MAKSVGQRSERLYRVKVKGGGSFLYDTVDVGRFFRRMAEVRDTRPIKVRPTWTRVVPVTRSLLRINDWVCRRVLILTMLHEDGSKDWSSGSVNVGDFLTLWWRPLRAGQRGSRRGVLLRCWRFQASASRGYAYLALTDGQTYIDVFASVGSHDGL